METRRTAPFAANLRRELSERNRRWAREQASPHELSYGAMPTVVYPAEEDRHGNFHLASYAAILAQPEWRRRLDKVHTQARMCLPRTGHVWRELDSCNSSDALLMNIFCHPEVLADHEGHTLLGIESAGPAVFGYRARAPLIGGRVDRTEVDMLLPGLLVEAKLTEADFQSKPLDVLMRYRDLETVFDVEALPIFGNRILSYQLIRNVLCAHATGNAFCVFCDRRRPDLIEDWYRIMRCVVLYDLRPRLKLLTWQELSGVLPAQLQEFLAGKYGIAAPGKEAPTLMNEEDEPVEDACRVARGSLGRT
jgi:hypothetical protein